MEQWIKEGKQVVKMTRLSCLRFRSNEVRLWLSVIAYNLGNLWRRLVRPKREVVTDQLAAAVGKNRWASHEARSETAILSDAPAGRVVTGARGCILLASGCRNENPGP